MMELEFRIRREIIFGRTAQEELTGADTADSTTPAADSTCCDPMHSTRSGGAVESVDGIAGVVCEEADRTITGNQEQHFQPSAGGETRGIFEADREPVVTGWEREREAFLTFQNQAPELPQHQFPSSDDSHSSAVTDIVRGVVQLGQAVERVQPNTPVKNGTAFQGHIDHKARRKQKEKRIALGHAKDEKAESFEFQMSM